jgi:hypothetical protein
MPFASGLLPILERRPIVKQSVVVDKLHITRFESHQKIQARIVGQRIETIQGFDM